MREADYTIPFDPADFGVLPMFVWVQQGSSQRNFCMSITRKNLISGLPVGRIMVEIASMPCRARRAQATATGCLVVATATIVIIARKVTYREFIEDVASARKLVISYD